MGVKTLLAFVLGVAVAAGVAVFYVKRQAAQTPAATASAEPSQAVPVPSEQPAPAVVQPVPAEQPAAQPPRPSPSGPRRTTAKQSPAPAAPAAAAPTPAASPAPAPVVEPPPAPKTAKADPIPAPVVTPAPAPPPPPAKVTLAEGTLIYVRLMEKISTDAHVTGDSFSATLDQPLVADGFVIAERGARVQGRVADSDKAGRVKGVSHLSLELTQLTTSDGQKVPIKTATFEKEGDKSVGRDAAKVGAAAGIGAAIGAIAGGGRGAAIGAGVGGAAGTGGVLATRGKAAELPVETKLSFRLAAPVTITEKRR